MSGMRPPPKKKRRSKGRPGSRPNVRGVLAGLRPALYPAAALFWAAGIFVLAGALYPAVGDLVDVGAITFCSLLGVYLPDVGAPDSRVALLYGRRGRDLLAASREGFAATATTHGTKGVLGILLGGLPLTLAGPSGSGALAALLGGYLLHLGIDAMTKKHGLDLGPPKRLSRRPAGTSRKKQRQQQKDREPGQARRPATPGCGELRCGPLWRLSRPPKKT